MEDLVYDFQQRLDVELERRPQEGMSVPCLNLFVVRLEVEI